MPSYCFSLSPQPLPLALPLNGLCIKRRPIYDSKKKVRRQIGQVKQIINEPDDIAMVIEIAEGHSERQTERQMEERKEIKNVKSVKLD